MPGVLEGGLVLLKVLTIQKGARYGWDGNMASGNEAALCQNGIKTFIGVLKRASRPDGRCTVKCMLLQKGAVNYCGCISRIEGAYRYQDCGYICTHKEI